MPRKRKRRRKPRRDKQRGNDIVFVRYAAWVLKVTARAAGFGKCPGGPVANWVALSQLAGVEDEWGKEWTTPREGMLVSAMRIPAWLRDKLEV